MRSFISSYKNVTTILLYAASAFSLLLLLLLPEAASKLGAEDGAIENLTTLLLLIASIALFVKGGRLLFSREKKPSLALLLFLMAVIFFIFAGEEISWGQRLFGIESGEFMQQYNWQGEVNLHNLQTDVSNVAYHYGAFLFLIVAPLFRSRLLRLFKRFPRLVVLRHFIAPTWIALPSFVLLGMLDSRFVYIIEKPWAAFMYLLALAVGLALLIKLILSTIRLRYTVETNLLCVSLVLIGFGLFVSYVYAVDEQATNIISEYRELVVALGLCIFSLQWRVSDNPRLPDPSTAQAS